jgi:hypothetical protein
MQNYNCHLFFMLLHTIFIQYILIKINKFSQKQN